MTTSISHSGLMAPPDPESLLTTDIDERIETIQEFLCHELARALDVPPDHRVDTRRPLHAQGVGSMTALRLKKLLESNLGIGIETVQILQAQSVAELAALCALRVEDPFLSGKGAPRVDESVLPTPGGQR